MSTKEARRVYVIEKVIAGELSSSAAGKLLNLSQRQVFRLKGAVKKNGTEALAHQNRGKPSKRSTAEATRQRVIDLAQGQYQGASQTHLAELLAEREKIVLSAKTVGRILRSAGVPNRHTHKGPRRYRSRARRPHEGALIQTDASPFDWLEGRGPSMTLHGAIDDASSRVVGLCFRPSEDTHGYFEVLRQVVTDFGVPLSIYSDRHTIHFSPKSDKPSFEDEVAGRKAPLTQFGRALNQLGIEQIPARTPQAKGRIERLWGTLQERLVIELRVASISSMEEANAFLPKFIARYNSRFAVEAAESLAVWRDKPKQLERIICWREERSASNGSTISVGGQLYHLVDRKGKVLLLSRRSKVTVIKGLDGQFQALHEEQLYSLQPVTRPSPQEEAKPTPQATQRQGHKPSKGHDWVGRKCLGRVPPPKPKLDGLTRTM